MYFVWQQRLSAQLSAPDAHAVEVVHPGLRNYDAGPDFFNAKVRIDGMLWAGNVEMHCRASDWYRHHHDHDQNYLQSVILHVVLEADVPITLADGTLLPTVIMQIPEQILHDYQQLCGGQSTAPLLPGQVPSYSSISCASQLQRVPRIIINDWLASLCMQRMMDKMERVRDLTESQLKAWPEAFYVVLARSLGTGVNSDAMERLARNTPYSCLLHHRDNLLQLQAILLGQGGFLDAYDVASRPASEQAEWRLLQREYAFLRQKFGLTPLPLSAWRLGRVRPPAQPDHRLRALALMLHSHTDLFAELLEAADVNRIEQILHVEGLGHQTIRSLVINAVVPTLLCYAQWQSDTDRIDRTLALLSQLPPERNRYIEQWLTVGIEVPSAFQSQALLQLFLHYCQPHKCIRCRIGCWLLKNRIAQ